ncbi:MAG: glycosyltransferase family 2 protein [Porphyromonas sp.]|nr:glycosyltransferase family 2 protein [Porphyromonas sp.]
MHSSKTNHPNGNKDKVLAIIVLHNADVWHDLSFRDLIDQPDIDLFVIDNASTDNTPNWLKDIPNIKELVLSKVNIGFGMANNRGIEYAIAYDYKGVLLINQDAYIAPSEVRKLINASEREPNRGIISPMHYADENCLDKGFAHYAHTCDRLSSEKDKDFVEVPFINAALWYLPIRILTKVGGFSSLFFMYGEDKDYCNRVTEAGLKIGYLPSAKGYHYRPQQEHIPTEKRRILESVYHLTEWINPKYSNFEALKKGPVALLKKALLRENGLTFGDVKELWKRRHEVNLWKERPDIDIEAIHRTLPGKKSYLAPVLFFVYNRPEHTRQTINSLLAQAEAAHTDLIIFCDGAKDEKDTKKVEEVQEIVEGLSGFKSKTIHRQQKNIGLAKSIINGVTEVLRSYPSVIVLEDDLVLSPYFLRWMNDALDRYSSVEEVAHIYGCNYFQTKGGNPNGDFLCFVGSWGWGTWKRAWEKYAEWDGEKLLKEIESRREKKRFDFNNSYPYTRMLKRQVLGENNSWAIRWNASLFLRNKLSLTAGRSLVNNIGFDGSGTHCGQDTLYGSTLVPYPIYADLPPQEIKENLSFRKKLERYYRKTNCIPAKAWRRIRKFSLIL